MAAPNQKALESIKQSFEYVHFVVSIYPMDFTCLTIKIINYHHASVYPFYDMSNFLPVSRRMLTTPRSKYSMSLLVSVLPVRTTNVTSVLIISNKGSICMSNCSRNCYYFKCYLSMTTFVSENLVLILSNAHHSSNCLLLTMLLGLWRVIRSYFALSILCSLTTAIAP